ncbi:MAG: uracil-DNA glycosylase [bacterium]
MSKLCNNDPAIILKRLLDMGEDEIILHLGEGEPEDEIIDEPMEPIPMQTESDRIQKNTSDSKLNANDSVLLHIPSAIEELEEEILADGGCRKCALSEGRNKIVIGVGDPNARIVFIGEGPGAEEDKTGIPFVGRAGHLLDKIFEAMGLSREKGIYICNIVKCRPPGNRDPLPEESSACMPYLLNQLEIIKPAVICCLGRVAAQNLLNTDATLGNMRGKTHYFQGIPVIVTYHPAYLLRNAAGKKPTWEDMKTLLGIAGLPVPKPKSNN